VSATATVLVELATFAVIGGGGWLATRTRGGGNETDVDQTPWSPPRSALALPVARIRGLEAAEAAGWAELLRAGALQPVDVITDPGNDGRYLALVEDPTGDLGLGAVRVLVAVNGSPEKHDGTARSVHGIPVPAGITSALGAAAWAHDDPTHPLRTTPAAYAALAMRS
jgi:hypothetical protein